MALRRRGGPSEGINVWPGYVDALSTLLMVIIFVLLVFVLAQAFLSVALSGRDRALDRMGRQMAEISDMLALERGRTSELQLSVAGLNKDLGTAQTARESLSQQLATLSKERAQLAGERDTLRIDRDRLTARLADADLQARSALTRNEALQAQLVEIARRGDQSAETAAANATLAAANAAKAREFSAKADANASQAAANAAEAAAFKTKAETNAAAAAANAATAEVNAATAAANAARAEANLQQANRLAATLADARRELADTQSQLTEMRKQAAALDQTVKADRATIEARVSELAKLSSDLRNTMALRDELERQAQDAAVRATTEQQRREATAVQLADEKRLGESARAQMALLNEQMAQMRAQMSGVAKALELAESEGRDKDAQIANLGSKLNAALAQKVEELQRYRSEFFGRLSQVLANRPGINVVGDRFVFQSEVLFPVGSADLSAQGQEQMRALAATLKAISADIPDDVNWILRVDGHADRQPTIGRYASNWELSASRAITVVKLLTAEGVPANRLAATGFGENQPLDPVDSPEAYARNRRIELRLTDR
jgi:chemotaxis protein MotB